MKPREAVVGPDDSYLSISILAQVFHLVVGEVIEPWWLQ